MKVSSVKITGGKFACFVQMLIGWLLGPLFFIGMLAAMFDNTSPAGASFFMALFAGIGIYMIFRGRVKSRRIKRLKQYVQIISANKVTALPAIADMARQSVERVTEDLRFMIDKGYLADVWLNEMGNEIVTTDKMLAQINNTTLPETPRVEPSAPYAQQPLSAVSAPVVAQCKTCGATNEVPAGKTKKCAYCDSPVAAN